MNNNELGTLLTLFIVCCASVFYRSEVIVLVVYNTARAGWRCRLAHYGTRRKVGLHLTTDALTQWREHASTCERWMTDVPSNTSWNDDSLLVTGLFRTAHSTFYFFILYRFRDIATCYRRSHDTNNATKSFFAVFYFFVFLMQFGLRRAAAFVSSPIHLLLSASTLL